MNITINGNPADITLEKEQTLGELLSGIEDWLLGLGHTLSGLQVDGAVIGVDSVADAFQWDLEKIKTVAIKTSTHSELLAEALFTAREALGTYGDALFDQQNRLREQWKQSPAGVFLSEKAPELYDSMVKTLQGEGLSPQKMEYLIDERLREVENPQKEILSMGGAVTGIVQRLEDLPLDIQTGKDQQAAETVALFSGIIEKLYRLISLLNQQGLLTDEVTVEDLSIQAFIEEFTAALKELLAAYEVKDAVLVGDLAEYELAPRLLKLYSALRSSVERAVS
ncbi:hypothetical protein LQZ21_02605 [Treponema sp. TIM-1]|uniref:hypothetical protein n=1 Tax=Treponema sp. TIM-1 TaxID=2898417 RepID=UPI003981308A